MRLFRFLLFSVAALAFHGEIYASDYAVVLDPGHGGSDHGIVREDLLEKDLVLHIAKETEKRMKELNSAPVTLTRSGDYPLSFRERRRIANRHPVGLFMSLHFAAAGNDHLEGSQIFIQKESVHPGNGALRFGKTPLLPFEEVSRAYTIDSLVFGSALNEAIKGGVLDSISEISSYPLTPLMGIRMPAVLVEIDYLTGRNAQERWKDPLQIKAYADILAKAIDRFTADRKNAPL